ncbi:hypothetical protein GZ998_05505 [Actinomyces sp. 594]|uniref:hypothetical protein n=1 Tax=Actinomyces sp. 594 TaxID=2057793 RepID=UPI001C586960|nr:hypothetical protein [Actinomyces sp. 594]MBW3068969.1 hypothetical protein [Actinomyces sp. 594]
MSKFYESQHPRNADGKWATKPAAAPAANLGDSEPPPAPTNTVDAEAMWRIVQTYAHRAGRRMGVRDPDHIDAVISDVTADVIGRYGNEQIPVVPLYSVVSRRMARSLGHTNLGPTDRAAMRALNEAAAARAEELGRELTEREVRGLADEVRSGWHDPRHRPSRNFFERAQMARMGSLIDDEGNMIEGVSPWAGGGVAAAPDTPAARAEEALNAGRRGVARSEAWDTLATVSGAPMVARGSRSTTTATACRRIMRDYPGGVAGAVDAWQRAEQDEGTVALFAPFGDGLDEEGADAVCSMLQAHPEVADDLWEAALSASTRRYTRDG